MDLATTYTIKARVTGQDSLNGLNKGLGKVKDSSNKTAIAFNKLKSAGNSLMGVLGSIGATAAVTGFVKAGIDMQRTQKTLKVLTEEYGEHQQVLNFVDKAAERFGIGQHTATKGVSDLFARLRPMGISLDQIKDTYLGLNNAALRYNLSSADLAGVQLQLGQALGSGVLQGDEFRSIMERLPAIGQAVADVMGVQIGELKQLSSDGELTTEVIIQAMQKLKDMDVPPPDSFRLYNKSMENLSTVIGTKLLPAFTPFVKFLTSILEKFSNLPAPVQTVIAGVTALGAGLVIIAPALGLIATGFSAVGAAIGAAVGFFAPFLAGAAIPAAIIGLGVLIFKFRDQIGDAFKRVGEFIQNFFSPLTNFIGNVFNSAMDLARNAFNRLPNIVQRAIEFATAPLRGFIKFVEKILSLLGRVKGSKIEAPKTTVSSSTAPSISTVLTSTEPSTSTVLTSTEPFTSTSASASSIEQLQRGLPRSNDYVIPGQDMSIENVGAKYGIDYSSQSIPTSNPLVTTQLPSGGYSITNVGTGKPKPPNINIQTGNVVQMDNTNYVTTNQLQNAVQSATTQTMNYLQAGGATYYLP